MLPQLQDVVDAISRLAAASATLEDRDFNLVAFASQSGGLDQVRQRSILERRSTPEVRAYFEGFGIARSDRPVRTPADESGTVLPRVCLPARWNGVTYGYLWLLDEDRRLDDALLSEAMHGASQAGALMARQARMRERMEERLQNLLSPEPAIAEAAAEETAELGLIARDRPVAAIVLETVAPEAWQTVPLNVWRLPPSVLAAAGTDHVSLLVPLDDASDLRPARDIAARARDLHLERLAPHEAAGVLVGIGAARSDLAEARASRREARLAARVARAVPAFRPVAAWPELGVYRLLACGPQRELRDAVVDAALQPLLDDPDPVLLGTVRAYLDHAGSVQRTAAALNVHRQTLYYRLRRIEQLTGLDLDDGQDRLRLHLGVSLAGLVGGRR